MSCSTSSWCTISRRKRSARPAATSLPRAPISRVIAMTAIASSASEKVLRALVDPNSDLRVRDIGGQTVKIPPIEMDECAVVTAVEVKIGEAFQSVVHHGGQSISTRDRRNGPHL